jgi:hypothetical protein
MKMRRHHNNSGRRATLRGRRVDEVKRIAHKLNIPYGQPESVADFRQRIAIMMRERETGKKFSMVGASRAADCVVRKPHTQPKGKK